MLIADDPVIPLKFDGDQKPLVFIHPISGTITSYTALAQLIENRPVYAVQASPADDPDRAHTLEDLADHYLTAIHKHLAVGTYHLGGWSLGGVIAFEMAQQLSKSELPVGQVIMIDSFIPERMKASQKSGSAYWFLKDLEVAFKTSFSLSQDDVKDITQENLLKKIISSLGPCSTERQKQNVSLIEVLVKNYFRMKYLANNYKPEPYGGYVALLQASEGLGDSPISGNLNGWESYIPNLIAAKIPGNHFSMMKGAHVKDIENALRSFLTS